MTTNELNFKRYRGTKTHLTPTGKQAKKNKGFTLLELLISIAITLIILGAMYYAFIVGFKKWEQLNTLEKMNKEATFALQRMVRELRQATAIYSTSDLASSDTQIIFNLDINPLDTYLIDETVHYYRDSVDSSLMREVIGSGSHLVARNVSSFTLEYYEPQSGIPVVPPFASNTEIGLIKINLSLQAKNQTADFETKVNLRKLKEIVK